MCDKYSLPLFIDGARLGYGLCSPECDLTLPQLSQLADVFYIGGTKQGALFGEAVVIVNDTLKKDFRYNIKQHGGMLAKGRLLGIQFDTLFTDDLFFKAASHANQMAMKLKKGLADCGVTFLADSVTNQQFPIFSEEETLELSRKFLFEHNGKTEDNKNIIRFCTSWATKEENVEQLINTVRTMRNC